MESASVSFDVAKGRQWGKDTFTAQIPFPSLDRTMYVAQHRQRKAIPDKVESIKKYIIRGMAGRGMAGFSAIAVSLQEPTQLVYDAQAKRATFVGGTGPRFHICDGQHRLAGIKAALMEAENLQFEAEEEGDRESWAGIMEAFKLNYLPVVIFTGLTEQEEEQLFSDMNYLATPVNQSKALKHDTRDLYNRMSIELAQEIPQIARYGIDDESKVLSDKKPEVATLATWNRCTRILVNGLKETDVNRPWNEETMDYETEKESVKMFWTWLLAVMPEDYNDRSKYLIAKSVFMQGIAAWGRSLDDKIISPEAQHELIGKLADFDWSYKNDDYAEYGGGSLNPKGRMQFIGTRAAIKSIPLVLNDHVGISNGDDDPQPTE